MTTSRHYVGDSCPGGHQEEVSGQLSGIRDDYGKTRYELIPVWPLRELAKVYTMGAAKYGADNYLGGMAWQRTMGSLLRHVQSWRDGETWDEESGLHHLAHVAWNAFTLMMYEIYGIGEDDRWTPPTKTTPKSQ